MFTETESPRDVWSNLKIWGCYVTTPTYQLSVMKDAWIAGPVSVNRRLYGFPSSAIHDTLTARELRAKADRERKSNYVPVRLSEERRRICYWESAEGRSARLSREIYKRKQRRGMNRITI